MIFSGAVFCVISDAFIPRSNNRSVIRPRTIELTPPMDGPFQTSSHDLNGSPLVILHAKKKKGNAKSAALEALDLLEDDLDAPLSKKEQKALEKQKKKEEAAANAAAARDAQDEPEQTEAKAKPMSKKEKMLAKALELEMLDAPAAQAEENDEPKLSKKELKALKKKEEKMAAKAEKKAEKKAAAASNEDAGLGGDNGGKEAPTSPEAPVQKAKPTLEDKIRKERPPPRIRVMESSQPGFVSLRMENVGITFRNQEVLKDVTWGVQSGERIGLVGKNGAGKTTQLRIMSGELEPTTGDVVKSSGDLRTAILRQEFVDELVKERTLKEEFMSVFAEENQIVQDLKDAEKELETMSDADPDAMQEILDRMQDLQQKAEDKDVYVLESKVKKTMDLMGFNDDEADDLVASFSGGWKMRIGLGKVLLRDPNVLLLGEFHVDKHSITLGLEILIPKLLTFSLTLVTDEPTNHLDLESVEWLEAFLREQTIPMIIVSHDREFLDQVCTKIVDAEGGMCTEYDGNYSRFLELKKARMDSWQAAYDAQEKKLKAEKQWINKFQAKQPQVVKQRKEKMEKFLKSDEYVQKPPFTGKPFRFRFPPAPRLSPEVAQVDEMSHSYNNEISTNRLFDRVDLSIEKGDRIAVVG